MDIVTLCKLITCIVRGDRVSDGYLAECFQNGTMQRIIQALRKRIIEN